MRGEAIAALAGARTAEAIVPAIEPDDRYSGIARHEGTDVAASRCRHCERAVRGVPSVEAIVRHRRAVSARECGGFGAVMVVAA
jgi:flavoprotein